MPEAQMVEYNADIILPPRLHHLAQVCAEADAAGGAALLKKAEAILEARQLAQHGQWQAFLVEIRISRMTGWRYCAIAERAQQDQDFRSMIASGRYGTAIAALLASADRQQLQLVEELGDSPTRREIEALLRKADAAETPQLPPPSVAAARIFFEAHVEAFEAVDVGLQCGDDGLQLFQHGGWHHVSPPEALEALRKAERAQAARGKLPSTIRAAQPAQPAQRPQEAPSRAYAAQGAAQATQAAPLAHRALPEPPGGWAWSIDADTGAAGLRHLDTGYRVAGAHPEALVDEAEQTGFALAGLRAWNVAQNSYAFFAEHEVYGLVEAPNLLALAKEATAAVDRARIATATDPLCEAVSRVVYDIDEAAQNGQRAQMAHGAYELMDTIFGGQLRPALRAAIDMLDKEGRAAIADGLRPFLKEL